MVLLSLGCLPVAFLLIEKNIVAGAIVAGGGFTLLLVVRRICWLWLARRLRSRRDGFGSESARQVLPVRIEDARTTQKVKVVSEDQGICILDGERRRLLVEGCAYRYLICARDVVELRAISAQA